MLESAVYKEASRVPTPDAVMTVDDDGFGRVYFPQAGRQFRERNQLGVGQVNQVVFPALAHVDELSTRVREVFADSSG